jgi:hypothetical protein
MAQQSRFVHDGFCRAQAAAELAIRAQVIAEFSEQLAEASFWRRLWLRRTIEREVLLRLGRVAPPDALY